MAGSEERSINQRRPRREGGMAGSTRRRRLLPVPGHNCLTPSGRRPRERLPAAAARRPPAPRPPPLRMRGGRSCCSRWSRSSHRNVGRGDAELVDQSVEGIGDAADVPSDGQRIRVKRDRGGIAHLSDTSTVEVEPLVCRAGVLVVGRRYSPSFLPEGARGVVPERPKPPTAWRSGGPLRARIDLATAPSTLRRLRPAPDGANWPWMRRTWEMAAWRHGLCVP
jgi:hypothetical protein